MIMPFKLIIKRAEVEEMEVKMETLRITSKMMSLIRLQVVKRLKLNSTPKCFTKLQRNP